MESFQIGRRRNRSVVIAGLPALAIYFGLVLLQNGVPAVGGNMLFFAYVLSIPFVLMALVALGVWGGVGLLRAHFGKAEGSGIGPSRCRRHYATAEDVGR